LGGDQLRVELSFDSVDPAGAVNVEAGVVELVGGLPGEVGAHLLAQHVEGKQVDGVGRRDRSRQERCQLLWVRYLHSGL